MNCCLSLEPGGWTKLNVSSRKTLCLTESELTNSTVSPVFILSSLKEYFLISSRSSAISLALASVTPLTKVLPDWIRTMSEAYALYALNIKMKKENFKTDVNKFMEPPCSLIDIENNLSLKDNWMITSTI